ncbi:glycyl radical protein [Clostridium botulinum]|uniref:Glycyl radical protein n=1 Tax=Clostridium botulinum TaxID=1491 RepID=A0A846J9Y3_CLOBO|nr:glycyl radical protein [Clostridium botulinum]ACA54991.1 formate C-acetyltransferase [Clostridium botulinum A3 str. Loch Maree]NFH66018.1 glycyl radical protein [Clostridium botulinum]NFJ09981.1 glycyl radical protein [Clostridium botulinum]NFK15778.1 glycyl radical protein [Clostridium botulinum]NFM94076.1 glycyl radical protein [Clostridium botulinum]
MENRFGLLTSRMHNFREELLETKASIDATRAILTTDAYKQHADKPIIVKRAYMLKNILEKMPIFIEKQTLIVGNQAKANRAAPIFPEYAIDWVIRELDEFEKRDGDVFYIDEKTKEELRDIAPYWEHNTTLDKGLANVPPKSRVLYDLGIIKAEGNITSGDAHIAVDYGRIMKKGLKEYEERTIALREALDLTDFHNIKKYHFYEAILIVLDAIKTFAKRYSDLAREMITKEDDETRKMELMEIARIMDKVPYEPADNFYEAIQSMWFVHLILQIESNGHSLSYGRMDQYLYPYLKKDLESGDITEDKAVELLTNLWLKTFTINKVRSWSHTQFSAGSPLYQNVTVGGQTTDKKDAVNKLSYLIIKSVAQTRLPQPNLTVRYHKGLDDKFMNEAIEVLKLGTGMPAFNSDEVIIPSFIEKGVREEDAYNYSAIGCVEVAVPGKWGYRCTGMSFINFPKTLLISMNEGVDPASKTKLVEGLTHFDNMTSYEDLKESWDVTIREFTKHSVIIENCCDLVLEYDVPDVLCSALTEDCIGRGKTLKEGGAIYDFISGLQVGIANLADSLAAIKKLVFEEKKISTTELWNALMEDFASDKGKMIQRILIEDAPKYGNDDDYVDKLVVDAYNTYIDEVKKYPNTRYKRGPIGGVRYAGTSSISANVGQGKGTLATPDGRNAGTPLAEGGSPSHAMDQNGPTAVFKTVSKLPTHEITGGVLLNQKVTPAMLSTEENKIKLAMLIRTFFNRLEGFHVQYNVVSRDVLLDAQANPEKHRDLIVRVAGYSAFFNMLSKQTQDDIIERTEQTL